jgi:hypothetical protein
MNFFFNFLYDNLGLQKIYMKRFLFLVLAFFYYVAFASCNTASPEKYFSVAVLNSNMQFGFADDGLLRQFESPSVKMSETGGDPVPMPRSEVLNDKLHFTEETLAKIKDLRETADTKDILQNSIDFHEFVIAVYKNEYAQLAKLYDESAPKEQIENQAKAIHDKYFTQYQGLYNQLISNGKLYADRHGIKVNWGVYGK